MNIINDHQSQKNWLVFIVAAILMLGAVVLMSYVASGHDAGRILRHDAAELQPVINRYKGYEKGALASNFLQIMTSLRPLDSKVVFEVDAMGRLIILESYELLRDGRRLTGQHRVEMDLASLDLLVYASSLSNQQRNSDLWSIEVFCQNMQPCIHVVDDLWHRDQMKNRLAWGSWVSGEQVAAVLTLVHLLIKVQGGQATIDVQNSNLGSLQRQYAKVR